MMIIDNDNANLKDKNYDDIKVTILDQGSTRNGGSEPPAQVFTS